MGLLTPELGLFFWTVVVFTIVMMLLKKFAWKPITQALKEREASIEGALKAAEKAKEEMANLQASNEKLLNEAKEERMQILKEARTMKDSIVNEAKSKAKEEADKMIDQARTEINNQKAAAISEIKNQVGNLAVELAGKILKRELKGNKEQEKYLTELAEETNLN